MRTSTIQMDFILASLPLEAIRIKGKAQKEDQGETKRRKVAAGKGKEEKTYHNFNRLKRKTEPEKKIV